MTHPLNTPSSDDKLWAGLSYAGSALCMIPTIVILLMKKDESRFIKFHSLQALGFSLGSLVFWLVLSGLTMIPILGWLVAFAMLVIWIVPLAYWIYLMIQAFMGNDVRIPGLADFIDQHLMN